MGLSTGREKLGSMANTSRMTSYQRREQLIEIGRSLFAAKGFEAVSVEEIAATAKVSKPIVYEHFGGKEGLYANGYDVMIAKKICEANGWELEIVSSAWDSLCPAVQSGTMDANIAGQSMTADRMQEVDMAGPYYYATIVCVTTKDSPYAGATSIADLAGGKCTAQSGTIWYDSCLPQIENADLLAPAETAPAMIMQLQTGSVDFICTDMPTAIGAAAQDENLVILNFSGTDGDFQFASEAERAENVNIGISVRKGNTVLKDAIDSVLSTMTEDDFNQLMDEAIRVQPEV